MCFDICTINIRVSIRVRGLHLVLREHIEAGLENYDFILLSSKAIDMLTGGEPSCTTVNH